MPAFTQRCTHCKNHFPRVFMHKWQGGVYCTRCRHWIDTDILGLRPDPTPKSDAEVLALMGRKGG